MKVGLFVPFVATNFPRRTRFLPTRYAFQRLARRFWINASATTVITYHSNNEDEKRLAKLEDSTSMSVLWL